MKEKALKETIEEDQVHLERLKSIEELIKITPFKVEDYSFISNGGGANICFEDGTEKLVPKGVAIIYNLLKSKDKSAKEQLSLIKTVAENVHTAAPSNQQFYQTIIEKKYS
ncbi:hypothetical protein [Legionella gresilensis]|uniref:hypothetical protein n=1 Tax=Legionella gresilensis TaxID=91823 RepID=UPI001040FCE2|nr:hypothetical protein [Legionella gresilensis]